MIGKNGPLSFASTAVFGADMQQESSSQTSHGKMEHSMPLQFFVKGLGNQSLTMRVDRSTRMGELRELLEEQLGWRLEKTFMVYEGKLLQEESTVEEKVRPDTTIIVCVRQRGGADAEEMERLLQAGVINWQDYLQWHFRHDALSSEAPEDEARTVELQELAGNSLTRDTTEATTDLEDPEDPRDMVRLFEAETTALEDDEDGPAASGPSKVATSSKVTLDLHTKPADTKYMVSKLAVDMKAMTAMSGKDMYRLLRDTLIPMFNKEAMKRWSRKVEDHKSSRENVLEEERRMDKRVEKYNRIYSSVGLPPPPVIRANCDPRTASTGLLAFWAPQHQGTHVLFEANYTMKWFVKKKYDGKRRSQSALDAVEVKVPKSQHRKLPPANGSARDLARSLHLFGDVNQRDITPEQSDKERALKLKVIEIGLDSLDDAVCAAASFPSFRMTLGKAVKSFVWQYLDDWKEDGESSEGRKVQDFQLVLPLSPIPSMGILEGATTVIEGRVSSVKSATYGEKINGIFLACPHASIASYARNNRSAMMFAEGQKLDGIINLAVKLSGSDVPPPQVNTISMEYFPQPLSGSSKSISYTMKRSAIFFCSMQNARQDGWLASRHNLPDDLVLWLANNGFLVPDTDPKDKRSFIVRTLSTMRKFEARSRTADEKAETSKKLSLANQSRTLAAATARGGQWSRGYWAMSEQDRLKHCNDIIIKRLGGKPEKEWIIPSYFTKKGPMVSYRILRGEGEVDFKLQKEKGGQFYLGSPLPQITEGIWSQIHSVASATVATTPGTDLKVEPWYCALLDVYYVQKTKRDATGRILVGDSQRCCRMCQVPEPVPALRKAPLDLSCCCRPVYDCLGVSHFRRGKLRACSEFRPALPDLDAGNVITDFAPEVRKRRPKGLVTIHQDPKDIVLQPSDFDTVPVWLGEIHRQFKEEPFVKKEDLPPIAFRREYGTRLKLNRQYIDEVAAPWR